MPHKKFPEKKFNALGRGLDAVCKGLSDALSVFVGSCDALVGLLIIDKDRSDKLKNLKRHFFPPLSGIVSPRHQAQP